MATVEEQGTLLGDRGINRHPLGQQTKKRTQFRATKEDKGALPRTIYFIYGNSFASLRSFFIASYGNITGTFESGAKE